MRCGLPGATRSPKTQHQDSRRLSRPITPRYTPQQQRTRGAGPPRHSSPVAAPDASFLSPTKSYTRQGAHGGFWRPFLLGCVTHTSIPLRVTVRARQEERTDSRVDGVPRFSHLGIDKEKGVDTPGVGSYDISRATHLIRALDRQTVNRQLKPF